MSDVGGLQETAPVSRAAVLEERYRSRLPGTLDELTCPAHGTVQLPLHVAWSGLTAFDVDRPPLCASMYQVVLTEGLREDLAAFNRPPEATPYGPVLALDDVIGTKVLALADRGYPRDLVDIHAASKIRSQGELEALGRKCAWDEFSLEGLATRLGSVLWRADEEFSVYGLSDGEIADLRRWAQAWSDDINRRLFAERYAADEDDIG